MPDITMCRGYGCPLKDGCHRYTAKPDQMQSYFLVPPRVDGECAYRWAAESSEGRSFDPNTYRVTWSEADNEFVGTCDQHPGLSVVDKDADRAMFGIRELVAFLEGEG